MVPNTWNDACWEALQEIQQYAKLLKSDVHNVDKYQTVSFALGHWVNERSDDNMMAISLMKHAGAMAMHTLLELEGRFDADSMHKLLCQKQHDYGHGNIMSFGVVGVAVRLCDKIARATNLDKHGKNAVANETIIDTYADIVGYAVISIMLRNNTFQLELEQK